MRNPERIDRVLEDLRRIWKKSPDLRLGQVIIGCVQQKVLGRSVQTNDVFYIEDEKLQAGMKIYEGLIDDVPPRA